MAQIQNFTADLITELITNKTTDLQDQIAELRLQLNTNLNVVQETN